MRHVAILVALSSLCFSATATLAQTKIMPLGNSITMGIGSTGDNTGYRKPLYNRLKTNYSVNFVGSLQDGSGFDSDHEGHPGWKADQIRSNIGNWVNNSDPDMVIFHIGTNDISANRSTQDIINDIDVTMSQIWNHNSNIHIFLCSILPRTDAKNSNTVTLNDAIVNLVNQRKGSNPVTHVDQYNVIASVANWQGSLMDDYLHPNDSGYQLMADRFYSIMINYLTPVTPVELITFNGLANLQTVHLMWQTASESNNYGFDIERSLNGSPFEKVGFVKGNGTSSISHDYAYSVENNEPGAYQFRLKQIDTDGTFAYSDAIDVKVTAPALYTLLPSYPNPFSISSGAAQTNISIDIPEPTSVRVAIYDILGREVAMLHNGTANAGRHSYVWNGQTSAGSLVPSGTYFILMNTPGDVKRQKIQVIR
ncbi:MAG: T9SS type A sorting domain-containing protein [Deferribacteres bacterium]|nr:T9SS type A sorting domain-containing protein [candidate division KSB1 bacterium]MCB9508728.1 T9SS type A sorting domain-containing protein [Deferribacteres bacterium]